MQIYTLLKTPNINVLYSAYTVQCLKCSVKTKCCYVFILHALFFNFMKSRYKICMV